MADPIKVIKGLLGAEQDLADFIQNGPGTGLSGHVRDRFRDRCNEFANLPPWARALSGVAGGSINRFCTPYWGDNGWDGPVTEPPPFTGGQCPVNYRFVWQQRQGSTSSGFNWSGNINTTYLGPLSVVDESTGNEVCTGPGQSFAFQRLVGSGANQDRVLANGCVDIQPGWRLIDLIRIDGGDPNACGDPETGPVPGPNPPPNPGPLPGPEPTNNPDPDNPIPFIPIPPFDDPVFGPQPITGPSDNPATPPQPSGDNLPGEPDAVGDPIGDGVAGDMGEDFDFGQPPTGKIWVGCLVEFSVDNAYGNIPNTGPENTVYPLTVGNVSLRYGNLRGTSNQVRSRFTELFRPNTALEVTGAFVQTRPNTSAIVRPISVTVCKETQCSGE